MKKADCRKLYLEKRLNLTKERHESLSEAVLQQIQQSIPLAGKTISLFLPILSKKELNTYPLLQSSSNLQVRVALPVADFDTNEMKHLLYEFDDQIALSNYGIPEPQNGTTVNPHDIDIVFVPLTCFDLNGYRVGYGKGFYDRFLAKCRPDCQFIGLSLFEPIEHIDDVNKFDVKLHQCITPSQIFSF